MGQKRAVLVASMMSFQKIYGLHGLNHQIIEYSKKEKVITDKQINKSTDRISSCRLDPFCKRGRVKKVKRLSNCQTKKKPNLVTIWSEALSRGGIRDFCVGGPGLRVVYLVSQLDRSLPLFYFVPLQSHIKCLRASRNELLTFLSSHSLQCSARWCLHLSPEQRKSDKKRDSLI